MKPRTVRILLWLPFILGLLTWLALAAASGAFPWRPGAACGPKNANGSTC